MHQVAVIHGDGIGPEVVLAACHVVDEAGGNIEWHSHPLGLLAVERFGNAAPKETIEAVRQLKVGLKGPTTTPTGGGHRSANVELRKQLDLYACIRPIKSMPGIYSRFHDVDLVIVRENTEGLYVGQELMVQPGCVISLRTMTDRACARIAQAAFRYAQNNNRKKVTLGHKANILKLGDGLLVQSGEKASRDFPKIAYEQMIIDALCMRLVMEPRDFDVIFMENMFGDIVSDLCAGLAGGLGVAAGANMGDECAVFEAVHGSALDIAGKDLANPIAMIKSAVMMLNHLGEFAISQRIENALMAVLQDKSLLTRDLGGQSGTKQFVKNIIQKLR